MTAEKPTFEIKEELGNHTLIINRKSAIPIHVGLYNVMEAEQHANRFVIEKKIEYEKALFDFNTFFKKEHSALKEQKVVAWLCKKGGHEQVVLDGTNAEHAKELGYTVTELVKK